MSMVNRGGARTNLARSTRTRDQIMADFDNLPEDYRRVLRECPIQLELTPNAAAPAAMYELVMRDLAIKSCRVTYGDTHPQAFGEYSRQARA